MFAKKAEVIKISNMEVLRFGNKLLMRCENCNVIIQINKPIIGALHMCRVEAK